MTEEELVARHPFAWHMAEDGSWPGIRERGLLSAAALVDLYGVTGDQRRQLLSERRPQSVTIRGPGLPDAVIRDQKPMNDNALLKCLQDGLTPRRWYETLNAKTFLWVSRQRVDGLLQARAYRDKAQVVLTVDTRSLLATNRDRVLLCHINSGSTLYVPQPRGSETFKAVEDFPHDELSGRRAGRDAVVELVIEGGIPDIAAHVLKVERIVGGSSTPVWERPRR